MTMGGGGTAYDAVRMTLAAQQRIDDRQEAHHSHRRHRYASQMLTHIMERKEQMALLDSIEAQLVTATPRLSDRSCPECNKPFVLIDADGVEIDACLTCGSYWFDPGELKSLTHRREDIPAEADPSNPSRFECPICEAQMQEHRFRSQHDLLVDRCPNDHGVYLERDELVRAIDLTTALKLKRAKGTPPV